MTELIAISVLRQPLWLLLVLVPFMSLIYQIIIIKLALPTKYFDYSLSYWYLDTDASYKHSTKKNILLNILFWLFLSIAISGPQYPQVIDSNKKSEGDSVMVLLDVSQSMNSLDEPPSRLLRAKNELLHLIETIDTNDRLGVILFSGSSHLLFPPTNDKEVMRFFVANIKENMLPVSGSLIDKALLHSQQVLGLADNAQAEFSHIILMTDGDVSNENLMLNKIETLSIDYPVHVIGIGRKVNTPIPSLNEKQLWLIDHEGEVVISNRNDGFLSQIAIQTGGDYTALTSNKTKLDFIYRSEIQAKTFTEAEKGNTNWIQLYQIFLFLSVLIFFYQRVLMRSY